MNTLITLATIPAILALVNLCKRLGLDGNWSLLVAVGLGIFLAIADGYWHAEPLYQWAASGLILGLSAAGLFDATKTKAPTVNDYKIDAR